MLREIKLYYEDAFPSVTERWHAESDNGRVGTGSTPLLALDELAYRLRYERDRKRENGK